MIKDSKTRSIRPTPYDRPSQKHKKRASEEEEEEKKSYIGLFKGFISRIFSSIKGDNDLQNQAEENLDDSLENGQNNLNNEENDNHQLNAPKIQELSNIGTIETNATPTFASPDRSNIASLYPSPRPSTLPSPGSDEQVQSLLRLQHENTMLKLELARVRDQQDATVVSKIDIAVPRPLRSDVITATDVVRSFLKGKKPKRHQRERNSEMPPPAPESAFSFAHSRHRTSVPESSRRGLALNVPSITPVRSASTPSRRAKYYSNVAPKPLTSQKRERSENDEVEQEISVQQTPLRNEGAAAISEYNSAKRVRGHFAIPTVDQQTPKNYSETAKRIMEKLDQLSSPLSIKKSVVKKSTTPRPISQPKARVQSHNETRTVDDDGFSPPPSNVMPEFLDFPNITPAPVIQPPPTLRGTEKQVAPPNFDQDINDENEEPVIKPPPSKKQKQVAPHDEKHQHTFYKQPANDNPSHPFGKRPSSHAPRRFLEKKKGPEEAEKSLEEVCAPVVEELSSIGPVPITSAVVFGTTTFEKPAEKASTSESSWSTFTTTKEITEKEPALSISDFSFTNKATASENNPTTADTNISDFDNDNDGFSPTLPPSATAFGFTAEKEDKSEPVEKQQGNPGGFTFSTASFGSKNDIESTSAPAAFTFGNSTDVSKVTTTSEHKFSFGANDKADAPSSEINFGVPATTKESSPTEPQKFSFGGTSFGAKEDQQTAGITFGGSKITFGTSSTESTTSNGFSNFGGFGITKSSLEQKEKENEKVEPAKESTFKFGGIPVSVETKSTSGFTFGLPKENENKDEKASPFAGSTTDITAGFTFGGSKTTFGNITTEKPTFGTGITSGGFSFEGDKKKEDKEEKSESSSILFSFGGSKITNEKQTVETATTKDKIEVQPIQPYLFAGNSETKTSENPTETKQIELSSIGGFSFGTTNTILPEPASTTTSKGFTFGITTEIAPVTFGDKSVTTTIVPNTTAPTPAVVEPSNALIFGGNPFTTSAPITTPTSELTAAKSSFNFGSSSDVPPTFGAPSTTTIPTDTTTSTTPAPFGANLTNFSSNLFSKSSNTTTNMPNSAFNFGSSTTTIFGQLNGNMDDNLMGDDTSNTQASFTSEQINTSISTFEGNANANPFMSVPTSTSPTFGAPSATPSFVGSSFSINSTGKEFNFGTNSTIPTFSASKSTSFGGTTPTISTNPIYQFGDSSVFTQPNTNTIFGPNFSQSQPITSMAQSKVGQTQAGPPAGRKIVKGKRKNKPF